MLEPSVGGRLGRLGVRTRVSPTWPRELAWLWPGFFMQVPLPLSISGQPPTANSPLGHVPESFPWIGVPPENTGGCQPGATWARSCHHPRNCSRCLAWEPGGAPAGGRLARASG